MGIILIITSIICFVLAIWLSLEKDKKKREQIALSEGKNGDAAPQKSYLNTYKMLAFIVIALAFTIPMATSIGKSVKEQTKVSNECVRKGLSYYRSIGAYPKLSTGEDAYLKVKELCSRSSVAFN